MERVALGEGGDPRAQPGDLVLAHLGAQGQRDDVGDLGEVVGVEAAGGERRGADAGILGTTRYWTPAIHAGAFNLPPYIADCLRRRP